MLHSAGEKMLYYEWSFLSITHPQTETARPGIGVMVIGQARRLNCQPTSSRTLARRSSSVRSSLATQHACHGDNCCFLCLTEPRQTELQQDLHSPPHQTLFKSQPVMVRAPSTGHIVKRSSRFSRKCAFDNGTLQCHATTLAQPTLSENHEPEQVNCCN